VRPTHNQQQKIQKRCRTKFDNFRLAKTDNKVVYDYSKEDVRKIFAAIEEEVKNAKSKFDATESAGKKFKLR
jgi:hypothetical protein